MIYNEKYDLFVDDDFVMYRYNKNTDKFKQIKIHKNRDGYLTVVVNGTKLLHRLIWEIFNYQIPKGYEIDHINTIRTDNRIENLRCVTSLENHNNSLTRLHLKQVHTGKNHSEETKRKIRETCKKKTWKLIDGKRIYSDKSIV